MFVATNADKDATLKLVVMLCDEEQTHISWVRDCEEVSYDACEPVLVRNLSQVVTDGGFVTAKADLATTFELVVILSGDEQICISCVEVYDKVSDGTSGKEKVR